MQDRLGYRRLYICTRTFGMYEICNLPDFAYIPISSYFCCYNMYCVVTICIVEVLIAYRICNVTEGQWIDSEENARVEQQINVNTSHV